MGQSYSAFSRCNFFAMPSGYGTRFSPFLSVFNVQWVHRELPQQPLTHLTPFVRLATLCSGVAHPSTASLFRPLQRCFFGFWPFAEGPRQCVRRKWKNGCHLDGHVTWNLRRGIADSFTERIHPIQPPFCPNFQNEVSHTALDSAKGRKTEKAALQWSKQRGCFRVSNIAAKRCKT